MIELTSVAFQKNSLQTFFLPRALSLVCLHFYLLKRLQKGRVSFDMIETHKHTYGNIFTSIFRGFLFWWVCCFLRLWTLFWSCWRHIVRSCTRRHLDWRCVVITRSSCWSFPQHVELCHRLDFRPAGSHSTRGFELWKLIKLLWKRIYLNQLQALQQLHIYVWI